VVRTHRNRHHTRDWNSCFIDAFSLTSAGPRRGPVV